MQFIGMDCSGRSNNAERDSELGDDVSHDDHSDDENRDCDSMEGDHITGRSLVGRLNPSGRSSGGEMSYVGAGGHAGAAAAAAAGGGGGGGGAAVRSPDQQAELQMGHHHNQFPPNHPLNALGNFMGMSGLHGISSLQHNDVLEKLKIQVRDMKVGLMEQDYAHAAAFGANVLPTPINTAFTLPPTSMAPFGHAAQNMSASSSSGASNNVANGGNTNAQNSTNSIAASTAALTNGGSGGGGGGGGNSFSFTSPTAPSTKDVNPASNSSTSSEASNSSQQNNGWSFEEQYKQVRQLYEINDDPKRKEFLDDLFSFMQKRGSPINRLPIMAKSVLDLYELYNLVIARGGLVDVINKKLWQEIIKGLHLPSSITSAAFTLRTQYMKYLYPYECEKKNLSTPNELQSAIDGNRREGRRSSYGQYDTMHTQMQMPQIGRQSMPVGLPQMSQMSPLALVTHATAASGQAGLSHHRLMGPAFGQMPNLVSQEIEVRMMEYLKLIQVKKEQHEQQLHQHHQQQLQQQQQQQQQQHQQQQQQHQNAIEGAALAQHPMRQRSPSAESKREALNVLEMSRVALWQMYHNNTSPPASDTSPQGAGGLGLGGVGAANGVAEPQRSEALNLSDSLPNHATIKRERDRDPTPPLGDRNNNNSSIGDDNDEDDFHHKEPPNKRMVGIGGGGVGVGGVPVSVANSLMSAFPASFYLPHAAAVAAANLRHAEFTAAVSAAASAAASAANSVDNDEHDEEEEEDDGDHNTTANSSHNENDLQAQQHHLLLNGVHGDAGLHHLRNHSAASSAHNDNKSDDSAIENSPSTSASARNNGHHHHRHLHNSPVSTKKMHLSKQATQQQQQLQQHHQHQQSSSASAASAAAAGGGGTSSMGPLDALRLLSGLQFNVAHNGTGANGEPQLMVNLELNGVKYSGMLLANTAAAAATTTAAATATGATLNNKDQHAESSHNEMADSEAARMVSNGSSSSAAAGVLQEAMITS